MNDRYRPSEQQIETLFSCRSCGNEQVSYHHMSRCTCGGFFEAVGEAYPADQNDWEEERYPSGEWGPRRY